MPWPDLLTSQKLDQWWLSDQRATIALAGRWPIMWPGTNRWPGPIRLISWEVKVQQGSASQYEGAETEGSWLERGLRGHNAISKLVMEEQKLWWSQQTGQEKRVSEGGPPHRAGRPAGPRAATLPGGFPQFTHLLLVNLHFSKKTWQNLCCLRPRVSTYVKAFFFPSCFHSVTKFLVDYFGLFHFFPNKI